MAQKSRSPGRGPIRVWGRACAPPYSAFLFPHLSSLCPWVYEDSYCPSFSAHIPPSVTFSSASLYLPALCLFPLTSSLRAASP